MPAEDDLEIGHRRKIVQWLDELQACLVLKGGSKLPHSELAAMPLRAVLDMCYRNNITLEFFPVSDRNRY